VVPAIAAQLYTIVKHIVPLMIGMLISKCLSDWVPYIGTLPEKPAG